ncbi:MAG: DEAD/DEAH box helicase [Acidimicrobiales bacterium]|nr:DEAD/DEAH box helicase [Acidimicrobiales bacterium]
MHFEPHHWATFIAHDRPRRSCVAVWDPDTIDGLFDQTLQPIQVVLGDGAVHTVGATVLDMSNAIEALTPLPRSAELHDTFHALAMSIRLGLDLISRGQLLPWITTDGWDSWRVGPINPADALYIDRIAAALPAAAHCGLVEADQHGTPRIVNETAAISCLLDAVADTLVRTPAAALVSGSPAFADPDGMRVPHLRPWLTDLVQPFAAGTRLVISVVPPNDETDEDSPWLLDLSVRSSRDPSIVVAAEELWRSPAEVAAVLGSEAESEFLIGLRQASLVCPLLNRAMEEVAPSSVMLAADEVSGFMDIVEDLQKLGIEVRITGQIDSASIEQRPKVITPSSPPGDLPTVFDLQSLLHVEWEVILNGLTLTRSELDALANAKRPVVKIRGQWVVLDERQRRRLAEPPPDPDVVELLGAAVTADLDTADSLPFGLEGVNSFILNGLIADAAADFKALSSPQPADEPEGFTATLRPYQRVGLGWLQAISRLGTGGVLADDMGLGKTVQVLALHAAGNGPTLVVCPTSLITNWEREAAQFVPGSNTVRYHGSSRILPDDLPAETIVLTTYGVVRSDAEALGERPWNLVVADEAQAFKNPKSRTAKSMSLLGGRVRVALTGTPVENKLLELWSIASWVLPGYLGSMADFRRRFATPIERDDNGDVRTRLQLRVAPLLLRRRKTDPGIAPELPDKLERDVVVPLSAEQATLYKAVADQALDDLRSASDEISRQGMVLKMLTALKQITNHPANYLGETEPLANRSGKLDALLDLLSAACDADQSTLVFTQYVRMGNLITNYCGSQGFTTGFLHGGCSVNERNELVERFQSGQLPILILSLKAGGTGLNLTAASHVIHYDRWWNPAVEDQATDRAYRIGQDKAVNVHRLVTAGTVEDRIASVLHQKRELADSLLAGGEAWIGKLSNDELAELIVLSDLDDDDLEGSD